MQAYNSSRSLRNTGVDPQTGKKDLNAGVDKQVTVRFATTPAGQGGLATIYDIDEQEIPNPTQTDANGNLFFKAPEGVYDIITNEGTQDVQIEKSVSLLSANDSSVRVIPFDTVDQAINDANPLNIYEGAALNIREYSTGNGGGAMWDVVITSSVVPNGKTIVQSASIPSLSLKLRDSQTIMIRGDDETKATENAEYLNSLLEYGFRVVLDTDKVYWIDDTIIIDTGNSLTGGSPNSELKMISGANKDVIKTKNFDSLTGVGPFVSGPSNFELRNFKINGNYLDDWQGASIGADTTINNSLGYGVKIFGGKYKIDLEINNIAQVGFYSEVADYTGYGDEQECSININGRVYGKEGIIYRGPADVFIDKVFIGATGWLATQAERNSTIVLSDVYPGEPVSVMVTDEEYINGSSGERYHGHHEFGILHLYGNLSGWGYKCMSTGRIKGDHLIVENCRGGFCGSTRNFGKISILDSRNNGREPSDLSGTLPVLPGIVNIAQQGFSIKGVIRVTPTQVNKYLGYTDSDDSFGGSSTGRSTTVELEFFALDDPSNTGSPLPADVAVLGGSNQRLTINARDINGDCVVCSARNSVINIVAEGLINGSVVKRIAGNTSGNRGNTFDINAENVENVVNLDGLTSLENWRITSEIGSSQSLITGNTPDLVTRATNWNVTAIKGGTLLDSNRSGKTNLDNTTTDAQTVTVSHNFFTTPDAALVKFSLHDPSPDYTGEIDYIYLQDASETELTFSYKLSSVGTGGPIVLLWSVN